MRIQSITNDFLDLPTLWNEGVSRAAFEAIIGSEHPKIGLHQKLLELCVHAQSIEVLPDSSDSRFEVFLGIKGTVNGKDARAIVVISRPYVSGYVPSVQFECAKEARSSTSEFLLEINDEESSGMARKITSLAVMFPLMIAFAKAEGVNVFDMGGEILDGLDIIHNIPTMCEEADQ